MTYREELQAHVAAWDMHRHKAALVERQARDREAVRSFLSRNPGWCLHLLVGRPA